MYKDREKKFIHFCNLFKCFCSGGDIGQVFTYFKLWRRKKQISIYIYAFDTNEYRVWQDKHLKTSKFSKFGHLFQKKTKKLLVIFFSLDFHEIYVVVVCSTFIWHSSIFESCQIIDKSYPTYRQKVSFFLCWKLNNISAGSFGWSLGNAELSKRWGASEGHAMI